MGSPVGYSAALPTNAWMEDSDPADLAIDSAVAIREFHELYRFVAQSALVYLLPGDATRPRQVLVAGAGFVPVHLNQRNLAVLPGAQSEIRAANMPPTAHLLASLGYETLTTPFNFGGESEIRHLRDNVYIGGFGTGTERGTYAWMREHLAMRIVEIEQVDPYLLQLNNIAFPISGNEILVCTEVLSEAEIADIEKVANVIDVPVDLAYAGACGGIRMGDCVLNSTSLPSLKKGNEDYRFEVAKHKLLEKLCAARSLDLRFFHLGQFDKCGALLSDLLMTLNPEGPARIP